MNLSSKPQLLLEQSKNSMFEKAKAKYDIVITKRQLSELSFFVVNMCRKIMEQLRHYPWLGAGTEGNL